MLVRQIHFARSALLAWYDKHKRDLPWRRTSDPYAVWVSEVMLQQTQVDRVLLYYERFIARFPTVQSLAEAHLSDVLFMWRGLGYYSRARNLHKAAQELIKHFDGRLPTTVNSLRNLPGFGRYTAGAVASIALGLAVPLVDGNVARVLSRSLLIDGFSENKAREAALWAAASQLVVGFRPGDFNQALMELGATICLVSCPRCPSCPLKNSCGALATGKVLQIPPPKKGIHKKVLNLAVAVACREDCVLLGRRPEGGLFGGLWEMPCVPSEKNNLITLRKMFDEPVVVRKKILTIERILTHRRLRLNLYTVHGLEDLGVPPEPYVEWKWIPVGKTNSLAMSSAMVVAMQKVVPGLSTGRL